MFCPNCGKDSADFKFCPHCGTKIPTAEQQSAVWSVGMPCPHCGGTKLDGKNCAFCGAQLMVDVPDGENTEDRSYEIPYGVFRYVHSNDWVHLTPEAVMLHIDFYCKKDRGDIRIPYNELVEVVYERSEKETDSIFSPFSQLHFYWIAKGTPTFPAKERKTLNYFALDFKVEAGGERFFHLFTLIKLLSPPTVKFSVKVVPNPKMNTHPNGNGIDWDSYFQRFTPYRQRAAEELFREYAIPLQQARIMVDSVFEPRQLALYEQNSLLAIRDANNAIAEWERRVDEKIQERNERRARRNRRR